MQSQKQPEIAKINLNFIMPRPYFCSKKQRQSDRLPKRLHYCLQTKANKIKNEKDRPNDMNFNDTSYFYGETGSRIESNLLGKNKQADVVSPRRASNRRTNSVNIINIEALEVPNSPQQMSYFSSFKNASFQERNKKPNETISLQKSEVRRVSRPNTPSKKVKPINPYTKEQYLHLKRKGTLENKKSVQEQRLSQMQKNILKPCQIIQKELYSRELTLRVALTPSTHQRAIKMSLKRAQTARAKPIQQNFIQPWDSRSANHAQDLF